MLSCQGFLAVWWSVAATREEGRRTRHAELEGGEGRGVLALVHTHTQSSSKANPKDKLVRECTAYVQGALMGLVVLLLRLLAVA